MPKPIILVTMGDPGGIGPEVALKALRTIQRDHSAYYVLLGPRQAVELLKDKKKFKAPLLNIETVSEKYLKAGKINFLDTSEKARLLSKSRKVPSVSPGKISKANAYHAYAALELASSLLLANKAHAVATAPIHKTAMKLIKNRFVGHTEYFTHKARAKESAMMFVSDKLKVTLVTIHIALRQVSKAITKKGIQEKVRLTHHFLKHYLKIKNPKIAVCALNPHGSETGPEEKKILQPAVRALQRKGLPVKGPYSADQLFFEAYRGRYDALISMYHDQALAPFKMIAFHDGVNVTLGLPFIRTSPDHGTAFDIAYKGTPAHASMLASLRLASRLACNRLRTK